MEDKALQDFYEEINSFSKEVENVFMIISPKHREIELPGLLNRLGRIFLIVGEALQDQKVHELLIEWLKAYHDELMATVDFFYSAINSYKVIAAKGFKFGNILDRKITPAQKLIKKTLYNKLKFTSIRIMNYVLDIQSIFTNKQ